MVVAIGRSTDPSTVNNRIDVSGTEPASFRYYNAGAQYPSKEAARFGQLGYGVIGGNHKIARFPSPVNGAASNFDLLFRNYTGMSIGAAGRKWTGANGFGIPGYDPDRTLTEQMLRDANTAIDLLKAIAGRESGRGNNLTEVQWQQAHEMFRAGSADAYLANTTTPPEIPIVAGSKTGAGLLRRAREHVGETYENVLVPKDDAAWKGPWDCAEFASWLIYQEAGVLYGCIDDNAAPSRAEAYTGAWQHDVERLGVRVSVEKAAGTVGGILLRYPPAPGKMGHIAICDGRGGTVEAKGRRYGVVEDVVSGRKWHTGILIDGIEYGDASVVEVDRPVRIYDVDAPNMDTEVILEIQRSLSAKGFNHFSLNGRYDKQTQLAVAKFQESEGLVVDGAVGPETSSALGISLERAIPQKTDKPQKDATDVQSWALLAFVRQLLGKEGTMTTTASQPNDQGDIIKILLLLVLQSALSGKRLDLTDLLDGLLGGKVGGIQTVEQNQNDAEKVSRTDPIALLLPLLVERLLGPTNKSASVLTKVDSPPSPAQPAMTRPSVQLSVAGLAGTSILQALGILGTPFGLGALPTAAGTLATLIPILTGVFGATNGFSSLLGGVQSLFKGFAKPA